ncbi:MAG: nucleotidyl transferase AbiEii/AbiGii toxin family protein [Pseudomonadota bacterium]|nr:nucleotidyl transferase AbiEii/AbiGii toxin family protein [Pseudomonadota bacterium]
MNREYLETARLLIQVAPLVFVDDQFGLKGGTAINLFLRDMPRLSVDLDLVFTDHTIGRNEAIARINAAVRDAADRLRARRLEVYVPGAGSDGETKLMVRSGAAEVKVEINTVMRGTVHRVRRVNLTPLARDTLLADIEIPVLASEDVYGGKLVAALDRQHPRDLFDVMELFKHEGITPGIRRAFVVYLASHNRPVHEVLFPELRDIQMDYERNFIGMTSQPTELAELLETRDRMINELHAGLDANERRFLLSLVTAQPEWELLGIPHVSELPAVRWKLQNLARLQRERAEQFELQYTALAGRLHR